MHVANGTYRADRHAAKGGPDFPPGVPPCPSWLGREARAEYKRVVALLAPSGVLRQTDFAPLVCYCEAAGEFAQAVKELRESGHTTTNARGRVVASPWLRVKNKAADRMGKFAAHFGLSPSTRSRVPSSPPPPPPSGKSRHFGPPGA
jgi:P27 family predicted phage terminase small subunit